MADQTTSKRRSCADCVKHKRKCDMQQPRCRRCQKKKIPCSYPNRPSMVAEVDIPELDFPWLDDLMKDPGLAPWSGSLQPSIAKVAPGGIERASKRQRTPDYLPGYPEGYTRYTLPRTETEAAVHQFKLWPCKWLSDGKAPFIHPRVYSTTMPKPLQEAYAACAIYSTMTTQNAFVGFTVIESKANELLRSADEAAWTPLDLLAAVQALLIFQLIRLFDGDIRQRALAEKAESVLQAWTGQLQACTVEERDFTSDTAPSWRSWVFAESARRTVIMSMFLSGLYSLVKNGYCGMGDKINVNSFTAQRRLWDASSALEWERMRQAYNPYFIQRMNFEDFLREGSGSELDDFGLVMITTYKGKDRIDDWLALRSEGWNLIESSSIGNDFLNVAQVGSSISSSETF
ncbi:hypothetical protein BU24DRAFT_469487 [Aaosphaeria arxii CBS 175.79]|uniref:Zn(2)-C6 fungal-type domain-containing protein n=1 Tax=Aaosphaeria arxii CBS 175.79 TaxID=1450172 RepID=A0A6A5Y691_9PLEO|nr:uncharacterized protein BU24DRAFT_469487 [Aaosphaeria arxii CBS 175.79]KAF2020723.1 hypothetical protein BU24DRAFT_469487 [Aaosphaeria arxii CBS 175.79]